MAEWEKQIGVINLFVGNLEHSKAFYREVFGLPLQHEDEDTAMFLYADTYLFLQRGAAHQAGPSSDALSLAQKGSGNSSSLLTTWTRSPSWTGASRHNQPARRTVTGYAHPHLRRSGRLHLGDPQEPLRSASSGSAIWWPAVLSPEQAAANMA